MSLVDYGRILVRRGWIMILLALLIAGAAYFFSTKMTPVYRATQRVLILPSRSDFGLTEATTRLLNSRVAYLNSSLRASQIIENLTLDMEPAYLLSKTTIAPNRDTLEIQIDVDLEQPELAQRVATEWGIVLVQYQNDLNQQARQEDRINAQLQDNARVSQVSPKVLINALIGGLIGLFLGAIFIFVLEYLESSIVHRREDVENVVGLTVLTTVPPQDK